MKKITVVLAILFTVLMSGCGIKPKPLPDVDVERAILFPPPTSVEEAYNTTRYTWDEHSKTETTAGYGIQVPYRINGRVIGLVLVFLKKVNKEYLLDYSVSGEISCWSRRDCYDGYYHTNFNFENAIDKIAGELTKKSKERSSFIWFITEEQIKIMSTYGADFSLKYEYFVPYETRRSFPNKGYMEAQVPVVYVQGFLKKVNELHNKTK